MWDVLRNLLTIIGGIATIVTLFTLFRNRHKLRASGWFNAYRAFPGFRKELNALRRNVRQGFGADDVRLTKVRSESPFLFQDEIGSSVEDVDGYWVIEIENSGRKVIEKPHLKLPCKGWYITDAPDGDTPKRFEQTIEIGDLRSKDKIIVRAWTVFTNDDSESKVRVTHGHASVQVDIGTRTTLRILRWAKLALIVCVLSSSVLLTLDLVRLGPELVGTLGHRSPATSQPATNP